MGNLFHPHDDQPIRVPPAPSESKPTIGEKKAAASGRSAQDKNRKIILIAVCCVAVVLLISLIFSIWFFFGRANDDGLILNNVMVSGINLGGMTKDQAAEALHKATDNTYTELDMVVELPDMSMHFSPSKTGAKLDVDAVVKEAYNYGRKGSREEREAIKQASLTSTHHIPLLNYLNLDLAYIKTELDAYGNAFNSTYVPSSVSFDIAVPVLDTGNAKFKKDAPCQVMTLTIGAPGRHIDIEKLYNQILDAYSFNNFQVIAQLEEDEQLPDPFNLEAMYEEYRIEPVAAYVNPENHEIVPEIYGYDFDLEKAQLQLGQANYGDTVEIPFRFLLPEVSSEDLKAMLFRDVLASYQTQHSGNENRNTNLRLACEKINGLVLDPGDVFDFNTVVGQRTSAAGYKGAPAYDGGQTVNTVGGGICQISSTLYYCTLIADLEIIDRSPHSYVSSYMPIMGTDATVSWGGPEFSFKNNTNYPIRIEAKVEDGYVKMQLIGTDEKNYYIEMECEVIGRIAPDTVYKKFDADNEEGYKNGEVITTPYTGYSVKTYKLKYDKETGELISREFDRTSLYKKRDKVIAKIEKEKDPVTEEPDPTKPSKDESSKDESSKDESSKDESSKDESPKNESSKDESSKNESSKDESSKDESSKDESSKDESSKDGSSKDESSKDESSKDESSKDESSKNESSKDESSKDESSKDESSKDKSSKDDADKKDTGKDGE